MYFYGAGSKGGNGHRVIFDAITFAACAVLYLILRPLYIIPD
jgi:hypothetical protein